MTAAKRRHGFRQLAKDLQGIDTTVYQQFELDPCEPIIGEGEACARIAFFGRDPGREEVRWRQPFIGAGGQKVRAALHQILHKEALPDFEASVTVGQYVFWANTVPYKPVGNKAWSQKVKRLFRPLMTEVLLDAWQGEEVITLGREAFLWFGLAMDREQRKALEAFWGRPDRFDSTYSVVLTTEAGNKRTLRLHPLPHPSPLNATWYRKFPDLLIKRLDSLNFSLENWQVS